MAFGSTYMVLTARGSGGNPNANALLNQYGNKWGPRTWSFLTTDSSGTVQADGYFDDFAGRLWIGDKIKVVIVDNLNPALRTTAQSIELLVNTI